MRYTKKELRAVDMFALLLMGLGIVFVGFGVYMLAGAEGPPRVLPRRFAGDGSTVAGGRKVVRSAAALGVHGAGAGWDYGYQHAWILLGVVYASLGMALNLALRRVLRNDREDVIAPHDEGQQAAAS